MDMKRLLILTSLTAVLVLGSMPASAEPALVFKSPEARCVTLDGDGNLVEADGVIVVITDSQTGRRKLQCRVKNVANPSGTAIHYDTDNNPLFPGLQCALFDRGNLYLSQDWKIQISASGNNITTCLIHE